jgi:two-component system, NtrC family, sensor histidine kinase KinB
MKIKTKILLATGLLFAMVAILTILGGIYITRLSDATKNILVANYNTLEYSRQMLNAVNGGLTDDTEVKSFQTNLALQQRNITEPGEKELTEELAAHFNKLMASRKDTSIVNDINFDLTNIMRVNMQAIEKKSLQAEKRADNAIFWMIAVGTIFLLISFTLLINLPGNIGNPLRELTDSIKEIADKNYSKRLHFEQHNEFGELSNAFNTMAQKLEEYQNSSLESLMLEKKRIETLINNMKDPVIGLDVDKRILFMNDVSLSVAGLERADVIGKLVQDVAVRNDLVRMLVQDLFNEQSHRDSSSTLPVKIFADGKESYFNKYIIPIRITPTGEKVERLMGNFILLQNITPYKELDFAKTNFISTISHELKTPIAAIKMSLQLLNNNKVGTLNEEQANLVESIRGDANRLLKITGELLNISQVESGHLQLSITETEVRPIIDYAVQANRSAAEDKHVTLSVSVSPTVSKVLADSEKTAWVLTNLLSNAIRYSYDNTVVRLTADLHENQVAITVSDSGQGIATEFQEKIFDRYFRIPGSRKEGTGLGLAISKDFVEAQGGTIAVTSEIGKGSNFTFTLPSVS